MSRWLRFILATALGIAAGLFYGWVISPIEYVDTTPDTLRADYKTDYVLMTAEIYHARQDLNQAARDLALLGSDPPADIAERALTFARQIGYAEGDIYLLEELHRDLQTWQPLPGGNTP
ncbi:MAG: hypothetical protein D6770_04925 [Anaerolineae bacterium]|nr:MAG: hypothetical protein D6770_04925 [Anaerolineae bacterium]